MKKKYPTRKQCFIFFLFLTCAIAYHFPRSLDVTAHKINSLSKPHERLVSRLDKPLKVELYGSEPNIIEHVKTILSLFQKESHHIILSLHHEPLNPLEKRRLRLKTNHHLLLTYDDRQKAIDINPATWNEQAFANLLHQMIRATEAWAVFLSGHGECDPLSHATEDLGQLTTALKTTGINIALLNLGEIGTIPDNTKMLVIADPKIDFLPEETTEILNYLNRGGNLLWLVNPDATPHLEKIAQDLGIRWQPGTLLDERSQGTSSHPPTLNIMRQYPTHPITESLNMLTVFPWARSLQYEAAAKTTWQASPLLVTHASTRREASPNPKSQPTPQGPFTLGIALERKKQRVVAIGSTHFLSNARIHHYGNWQLANNLFNWLMGADEL